MKSKIESEIVSPSHKECIRALNYIRKNLGRTCDDELWFCDHPACEDSYYAWIIADNTLRGLTLDETLNFMMVDVDES